MSDTLSHSNQDVSDQIPAVTPTAQDKALFAQNRRQFGQEQLQQESDIKLQFCALLTGIQELLTILPPSVINLDNLEGSVLKELRDDGDFTLNKILSFSLEKTYKLKDEFVCLGHALKNKVNILDIKFKKGVIGVIPKSEKSGRSHRPAAQPEQLDTFQEAEPQAPSDDASSSYDDDVTQAYEEEFEEELEDTPIKASASFQVILVMSITAIALSTKSIAKNLAL